MTSACLWVFKLVNLKYKTTILLCLQLGDLLYEKRQYGKAKWACIKMKEKQYEQSICLGFMKLMRYICEQNSSGMVPQFCFRVKTARVCIGSSQLDGYLLFSFSQADHPSQWTFSCHTAFPAQHQPGSSSSTPAIREHLKETSPPRLRGTDADWLCMLPARPKAFAAGCHGVAFTTFRSGIVCSQFNAQEAERDACPAVAQIVHDMKLKLCMT